ncbi:hypothetical protein FHW69_000270 [Luteibacter sp. Sphag1AF]|uniref:hypothetical protein n=1 Tax=Luteibacter sp. Sphag1AF TaxID=2587031 RepID=UPI00160AFDED|nr:hypothetical protein [Luteibacter sp. Sphag1AF]MBB3225680.1 hypothetical protein [Luteibacter sp. Sphag1AF]
MRPTDQTVPCPTCNTGMSITSHRLHEDLFLRLGDATALNDLMSYTTEADVSPATLQRMHNLSKRLLSDSLPAITAIWLTQADRIPPEALEILKAGPFDSLP